MVDSSRHIPRAQLGRALRERFVAEAQANMAEVVTVVHERLTELLDEVGNARDMQARRDLWMAYREARKVWQQSASDAWLKALEPIKAPPPVTSVDFDISGLQLVDAGVMDKKILASRMVQGLSEKLGAELDDLKVRIKLLEHIEELDPSDVLLVDNYVQLLVENWVSAGLDGDSWPLVSEAVQRTVLGHLQKAYKNANALLVSHGILPVIELKDRVRGPVRSGPMPGPASSGVTSPGRLDDTTLPPGSDFQRGPNSEITDTYAGVTGPMGSGPMPGSALSGGSRRSGAGGLASGVGAFGGRLGWGAPTTLTPNLGQGWRRPSEATDSEISPAFGRADGASSRPYAAAEETRMLTAHSPMVRAKQAAQGLAGQMQRIFVQQTATHSGNIAASGGAAQGPTPALAQAIAQHASSISNRDTTIESYTPQGVAQMAGDLRAKTADLKDKAKTKSEKATIEIVALMFQAILAEERIPPGIRVWFARLQMPVLRTALEDPDFFSTADHPARLLIDRMGSCVMGFEGGGVQSTAMEKEVKRIVQVVEQYPETGKKVYQIVYAEFQKFLAKFLTEKSETQRVVSVAQQVEQKETLAIQYTIEMRNMLREMPVRDEIRDFLFKVWAEVLAVCALRKGPKHADTQALKKCATDLVWSASAKPNREDRARVIQDLPSLLLSLRSGMTMLGLLPDEQEAHVKKISDTLADAFMSKTQTIAQEKIDAMAKRLAELEDIVSEDGLGDLALDAQSIEMMLGIESDDIEVVANGGSKPTAAMLAWAQELEIGAWFTLDHNGQVTQVQFAWRSDGNQLNLFATATGKTYLIQTGRLAAYLQAGLLLPHEEEALTVRATRDALAKIEANPERLLV